MTSSFVAFLPAIFLSLSLLALYLKASTNTLLAKTWVLTLVFAIVLALFEGQIEAIAIPAMMLIATLAWTANRDGLAFPWRLLAGLGFTFLALALGLHLLPGFHPLPLIQQQRLTPDAIPYSLNLNFDKALIGLFLFGLWYQRPSRRMTWTQTAITMLWMLPIIIASVVLISLLAGYIRLEPKLIEQLGVWMWANLFFTCSAEEAFFRGLIQHRLVELLKNHKGGDWLALVIAASLFGLAHLGGGWMYALLAIVAGLGYGLLYKQTGRIEASIVGHFSLNLVHVLLFSYPALARSV